jgi:hypothetical protein
VRSAAELVRAETDKAGSALKAELQKLDAQAAGERDACIQALAALLTKHDLPDAAGELRLGHLPGARYSARSRVTSPTGVAALLELDIAPGHALAHVLPVSRLLDRLEVQLPEARKDKVRAQRLDKEYVTELFVGESESTLKLRATPEGGGIGYDVTIQTRNKKPAVTVSRTDGDGTFYELGEGDAAKLVELRDKLAALCRELTHKSALIDAWLDGTPVREHVNPRLLVERMIASLAPIAEEIARRSLTPNELVLKRQLGDGRREEIFVTKDELRGKIASLAPGLQKMFAPLAFIDGTAPPKAPPKNAAKAAPKLEPTVEEPTMLEKSLPDIAIDDLPDFPIPPSLGGKPPAGKPS